MIKMIRIMARWSSSTCRPVQLWLAREVLSSCLSRSTLSRSSLSSSYDHHNNTIIIIIKRSVSGKCKSVAFLCENSWTASEIVESTLCIHFSTFLSVLYCLCSRVRTSGCCPTMNDFPWLHHCQPFHYLVGHHHCLFHHLDHLPQSWSSPGCARLSERLSCSFLPVRRPS